jgi:vanillate O-demethylase ferredoxin subunit
MKQSDHWDWLTVVETRLLTPTIREFTLATPWTGPSAPGEHIDVEVIVDGKADTRSYSIVGIGAGDPGLRRIAVKAAPESRGGSRYMWSLAAGARLKARSPSNSFELSLSAPAYLLIAGGIGVTPIVAMAERLALRGADVRMLYAVRSADELAYAETLAQALGDNFIPAVEETTGRADLAAAFAALPDGGEVYICGPIGMLDAARRLWAASGRPRANLRFETFGSSGRHANAPFTVKVPRLGIEAVVPENRSLLEVLEDLGVGVLADCRRGECGLCVVDVVACQGEIDHRDVFLSPDQQAEGRKMCACVSRIAGGELTIEPAYRGDVSITPSKVFGSKAFA